MRLFKKKLSRWILNGKRVPPRTVGAIQVVTESRKWYVFIKGKAIPLSADKSLAMKMARKLAGDAELRSVGLMDPYEPFRDKPIVEHLEDYRVLLEGKGSSPLHVQHVINRVQAVINGCEFKVIGDIDQGKVTLWLAEQRRTKPVIEIPKGEEFQPKHAIAIFDISLTGLSSAVRNHGLVATGNGKARRLPRATLEAIAERMAQGMSLGTVNHYIRAMRAFTRWLELSDRIRRNPLKGLELLNSQVEIRRARRELTEHELIQLLESTRQSTRVYRGLGGEDRACLYLTASVTGFRAKALANLKPSDFDLRSKIPTVTLAAKFNKSKKPKVQPITPEAASVLERYLHHKPKSLPVWSDSWLGKGAEMIRHDLEAVGIPYVVVGTHGPEYADFHALRHSYLTLLGRSGVDLRTAQILAGHSTPAVTARYCHKHMDELFGAVSKLPMLTQQDSWTFSQQPTAKNDGNGCNMVAQRPYLLTHSAALAGTQPILQPQGTMIGNAAENTQELQKTA